MKKFISLISISFMFFCLNPLYASQYSTQDKQLFYDAFINSYIMEMQRIIDSLDVDETKKHLFMQNLKKDIDREYLIKSSWDCIQNFPVENIVQASILCTSEWNKRQSEKNKHRFETLKK